VYSSMYVVDSTPSPNVSYIHDSSICLLAVLDRCEHRVYKAIARCMLTPSFAVSVSMVE